MSSSLNSHIADPRAAERGIASCPGVSWIDPRFRCRRKFLTALVVGPWLCLPRFSRANVNVPDGLRPWGRGEFRRFGFLVYEAALWAKDDPQRPPLALRLDYRRSIEGRVIAAASVKEMRRFVTDESLLQRWGTQMQRIFPDVKPGDHILGVYDGDGAHFYQNEVLLGRIDTTGFAETFFAIWLDARTSAPELRAALLRSGER